LGVVRKCHMLMGVEVERCHAVSAVMRTRETKGIGLVLGRSGEDAHMMDRTQSFSMQVICRARLREHFGLLSRTYAIKRTDCKHIPAPTHSHLCETRVRSLASVID
jgi:hypothetical protein